MSLAENLIKPKEANTFVFADTILLRTDAVQELAPVSTASMYTLVDSPKKDVSLDELAKCPDIPILAFTGTLYSEIRHIAESLPNSEFALFPVLTRIDQNRPHFLAYAFFMPEQSASGGGVSLDGPDCTRYFQKLQGRIPHKHICHLHSHASMQTFWSNIDNAQQLTREDLGFMDDFRFYCVVNAEGAIKCSLVIYQPVLVRIDAAVALSFGGPGHNFPLTRSRKQELDQLVKDNLKKSFASTWSGEFAKETPAWKFSSEDWSWDSPAKTEKQEASAVPVQSYPWWDKEDKNPAGVFGFVLKHGAPQPEIMALAKKNVATFAQASGLDPEKPTTLRLLAWMLESLDDAWDLEVLDEEHYALFGELADEAYGIVSGKMSAEEHCHYFSPAEFFALSTNKDTEKVLGNILAHGMDELFFD